MMYPMQKEMPHPSRYPPIDTQFTMLLPVCKGHEAGLAQVAVKMRLHLLLVVLFVHALTCYSKPVSSDDEALSLCYGDAADVAVVLGHFFTFSQTVSPSSMTRTWNEPPRSLGW